MIRPVVAATILGMAAATYATKAGGLWLLERVELSDAVEAWLETLPGVVLVAILAPSILSGGPPVWIATVAVLLVAVTTGRIFVAMVVGVGLVFLTRQGLPI